MKRVGETNIIEYSTLVFSVIALVISSITSFYSWVSWNAKVPELLHMLNIALTSESATEVYAFCDSEHEAMSDEMLKDALHYLDFFEPFYLCIKSKSQVLKRKQCYDSFAYRFFIVANNRSVRKRIFELKGSTISIQNLYKEFDEHLCKNCQEKKPFAHYLSYTEWSGDSREKRWCDRFRKRSVAGKT